MNAEDWAYGMSLPYLRSLVEYATSDAFDWKRVQDRLNSVPQFTASVPNRRSKIHKNRRVHFYHLKRTKTASGPRTKGSPRAKRHASGIPLLLIHGWPSTPTNFIAVLPLLADAGFDVVAPSIPGVLVTGQ